MARRVDAQGKTKSKPNNNLIKPKMKKVSDKGKWFVSADGTAVKCDKESFLQWCLSFFGAKLYREKFALFRRATFEEYCKLELQNMESI